jgi:hypothetical protein
MDDVRAGVYRHYKGQHYLVLGLAHDANAEELCREYDHESYECEHSALEERVVVVYIGLELDGAKTGPRLAVRDYDDFFAELHEHTRTVCDHPRTSTGRCTVTGALLDERFAYIGPTWEGKR